MQITLGQNQIAKTYNKLVHSFVHKSQYNLNIIYVFCCIMIIIIQNSME